MKKFTALPAVWMGIALLMVGCAGSGGSGDTGGNTGTTATTGSTATGGSTGSPATTGFVYSSGDRLDQTTTLYRATVDDPNHPVVLHAFNTGQDVEAAINPTNLRVFYRDSTDPNVIRVVNWDGTGDTVFYTGADPVNRLAFLPNGNLSFFTAAVSGEVQSQINLTTKSLSAVSPIHGNFQPSYELWNADRTQFLVTDASGPTVFLQPANGGEPTLLASDARFPRFDANGTILATAYRNNQFSIFRFSPDGTSLGAVVPNVVNLSAFWPTASGDFIGQGELPNQTSGEVVLYHPGNSKPVSMNPGLEAHSNALLDVVAIPAQD